MIEILLPMGIVVERNCVVAVLLGNQNDDQTARARAARGCNAHTTLLSVLGGTPSAAYGVRRGKGLRVSARGRHCPGCGLSADENGRTGRKRALHQHHESTTAAPRPHGKRVSLLVASLLLQLAPRLRELHRTSRTVRPCQDDPPLCPATLQRPRRLRQRTCACHGLENGKKKTTADATATDFVLPASRTTRRSVAVRLRGSAPPNPAGRDNAAVRSPATRQGLCSEQVLLRLAAVRNCLSEDCDPTRRKRRRRAETVLPPRALQYRRRHVTQRTGKAHTKPNPTL